MGSGASSDRSDMMPSLLAHRNRGDLPGGSTTDEGNHCPRVTKIVRIRKSGQE